jgi:trans-aconitate methyltransferase
MVSTARTYFEGMYARTDDPWAFATSAYEQRKYAVTMASLPNERYERAFEPGCSVGVLSEQLATRCDQLLATDIIDVALEQAARRLRSFRNVVVESRSIPEEWPGGTFDLVVLSEVVYYFDDDIVASIMDRVVASTSPGAHVVGVHWRGETDYPLSGDRAHELIGASQGLRPLVHHGERKFVLDVWERS